MAATSFFSCLDELVLSNGTGNATVAETLADFGAPTASIAILDDGHVSSQCISTQRDDTETLFQAASISKPTTGVCIARLVDLGKLSFDDRICDLLPERIWGSLAMPSSRPLLQMVTIRQLMSHTAGLNVGNFLGYRSETNVPTAAEVLAGGDTVNTPAVKLQSLPGLTFSYSGGGYVVLQLILEHVLGNSFPKILNEYVFEPLHMERSYFILPSDEHNVSRANYHGHARSDVAWHTRPEFAAGGLWTTSSDVLKLTRAIQTSLNSDDGLLKNKTAVDMLTRVYGDLGLSWFVSPGAFGHCGGNPPGWTCFAFGYADLTWNKREGGHDSRHKEDSKSRDCGVCVMTNSADGKNVIWKLIYAICYMKSWPGVPASLGLADGKTPFHRRDAEADMRWRDWIGQWGRWWIDADDAGLPVAGVDRSAMVVLKPAAIPAKEYLEGSSVDLVLDGFEIMLRLCWERSEAVVEVWNGLSGECETLHQGI